MDDKQVTEATGDDLPGNSVSNGGPMGPTPDHVVYPIDSTMDRWKCHYCGAEFKCFHGWVVCPNDTEGVIA